MSDAVKVDDECAGLKVQIEVMTKIAAKREAGYALACVQRDKMARALEELHWLFEDKQDITDNGGPNDAMCAIQIIDAALHKAKGGEQS